ncbi:MAG: 50S ribosomal protein L18 [bacterium]|nr:50S ribosomal protein L18 [bacterium]
MNNKSKQLHRISRHRRVRAKIVGTKTRPRVSVFKSNKHIFVQLIDDESRKTVLSSKIIPVSKSKSKGDKSQKAAEVGKVIAEKAKTAGISEVVFDRGGYKYHGRIKALADGLRAGGLKF